VIAMLICASEGGVPSALLTGKTAKEASAKVPQFSRPCNLFITGIHSPLDGSREPKASANLSWLKRTRGEPLVPPLPRPRIPTVELLKSLRKLSQVDDECLRQKRVKRASTSGPSSSATPQVARRGQRPEQSPT
jgi:hypothetical protein